MFGNYTGMTREQWKQHMLQQVSKVSESRAGEQVRKMAEMEEEEEEEEMTDAETSGKLAD